MLTGRFCEVVFDPVKVLPRRFCSASTAESNRLKSWSSNCLIEFAKSAGRICRALEVAAVS